MRNPGRWKPWSRVAKPTSVRPVNEARVFSGGTGGTGGTARSRRRCRRYRRCDRVVPRQGRGRCPCRRAPENGYHLVTPRTLAPPRGTTCTTCTTCTTKGESEQAEFTSSRLQPLYGRLRPTRRRPRRLNAELAQACHARTARYATRRMSYSSARQRRARPFAFRLACSNNSSAVALLFGRVRRKCRQVVDFEWVGPSKRALAVGWRGASVLQAQAEMVGR